MKKLLAVAFVVLALSAYSCGGSSGGADDPSNPPQTSTTTTEGTAASTVAASACTGSSSAGFDGAMENAGGATMVVDSQKQGVSALVAEKILQHVHAKNVGGMGKSLAESASGSVVLENETISGDSGTMTISGTLNYVVTEYTFTYTGTITVVSAAYATTETVTTDDGDVTYTVTLDGSWTMDFDGEVVVTLDGSGNLQSFTMTFSVTANSETPLDVNGVGSDSSTFTGTVDIDSLTVSLDYNGSGDMAPTCSGSITATIEGETGTQTCVIKSDCSDCQ